METKGKKPSKMNSCMQHFRKNTNQPLIRSVYPLLILHDNMHLRASVTLSNNYSRRKGRRSPGVLGTFKGSNRGTKQWAKHGKVLMGVEWIFKKILYKHIHLYTLVWKPVLGETERGNPRQGCSVPRLGVIKLNVMTLLTSHFMHFYWNIGSNFPFPRQQI